MRPLATLLVLLISMPAGCMWVWSLGQAMPAPNPLSISLDQSSQEATVTESQGCDVRFTGNVTMQLLPGQKATVTVEADVDAGWESLIEPAIMNFTGSGRQNFTAVVAVPYNWPASTAGILRITAGTTVAGILFTAQAEGNVTVRPYFRPMMESNTGYGDIRPGGQAGFKLNVWNYGNAQDTFDLKVSDRPRPNRDGWEIRLNSTVLDNIPAGEYREVRINVNPPQDWDWTLHIDETFIFNIQATSRGATGQGAPGATQSFPLYVSESGFNMPVLAILMVAIAAVVSFMAFAVLVILKRLKRRRRNKMLSKKVGGHAG